MNPVHHEQSSDPILGLPESFELFLGGCENCTFPVHSPEPFSFLKTLSFLDSRFVSSNILSSAEARHQAKGLVGVDEHRRALGEKERRVVEQKCQRLTPLLPVGCEVIRELCITLRP